MRSDSQTIKSPSPSFACPGGDPIRHPQHHPREHCHRLVDGGVPSHQHRVALVRGQLITRGFDHVLLLEDLRKLEPVLAGRRIFLDEE